MSIFCFFKRKKKQSEFSPPTEEKEIDRSIKQTQSHVVQVKEYDVNEDEKRYFFLHSSPKVKTRVINATNENCDEV